MVRREGGAWAASPELVGEPGSNGPPVLVIDSQGDLFVAWSSGQICYRRHWVAATGNWEELEEFDSGSSNHDLVVDGQDVPYWIVDNSGDISETVACVNGAAISDDDFYDVQYPTIAVGPNDTLVAVWEARWEGGDIRLFTAYRSAVKHYFVDGQRIATRAADGTLYYILSDHLGSTTVVADAAGDEVGHVIYDPFGGIVESTLPLTVTDRLFTGQRWDDTIGLYDYNARFYDPQLGQFTQPDSLVMGATNPIAWNRYAYVYNNPVNHTDSTGHFIDSLWDAYDLASDLQSCLGDSDSLACYMVPVDAVFLAAPFVPGIGDNVLRHADDVVDTRRILVVGEGSFEYSTNLRRELSRKGVGADIVATSYESRAALEAMGFSIPESRPGFRVMHEVDARDLGRHFPDERFDAIIFNNPHAGSGQATASLVEDFIESARGRLRAGGEIHINVTQRLLRSHSEVVSAFEIPGSWRQFAKSSHYAGRFGQSAYYAPYMARYTTGKSFNFWRLETTATLLSFVYP